MTTWIVMENDKKMTPNFFQTKNSLYKLLFARQQKGTHGGISASRAGAVIRQPRFITEPAPERGFLIFLSYAIF
jgi:hypothetical protein